jgi:hypothetical protein
MVRVIDLNEGGLTAKQVRDVIQSPEGAILRENGQVIARIEPADEIDLDDEIWAHDSEQVARGAAARQRFEQGQSRAHEDLKKQLMSIENDFLKQLLEDIKTAKDKYHYYPSRFLQIMDKMGPVGTVRMLLAKGPPSQGFYTLLRKGGLEGLKLTAEYIALRPEFRILFTEDELNIARKRLHDHGMTDLD